MTQTTQMTQAIINARFNAHQNPSTENLSRLIQIVQEESQDPAQSKVIAELRAELEQTRKSCTSNYNELCAISAKISSNRDAKGGEGWSAAFQQVECLKANYDGLRVAFEKMEAELNATKKSLEQSDACYRKLQQKHEELANSRALILDELNGYRHRNKSDRADEVEQLKAQLAVAKSDAQKRLDDSSKYYNELVAISLRIGGVRDKPDEGEGWSHAYSQVCQLLEHCAATKENLKRTEAWHVEAVEELNRVRSVIALKPSATTPAGENDLNLLRQEIVDLSREISRQREECDILKKERDNAVEFANRVERGESNFLSKIDVELVKIAHSMKDYKRMDESLSEAVDILLATRNIHRELLTQSANFLLEVADLDTGEGPCLAKDCGLLGKQIRNIL